MVSDNIPGSVIYQSVTEPDGTVRYSYISAGVERLFGFSAESVMQDAAAFQQLIVEEDRPLVAAAEQEALRDSRPLECEFRWRTATGNIKWVRRRSTPQPPGRWLDRLEWSDHRHHRAQTVAAGGPHPSGPPGDGLGSRRDGHVGVGHPHAFHSLFQQHLGHRPWCGCGALLLSGHASARDPPRRPRQAGRHSRADEQNGPPVGVRVPRPDAGRDLSLDPGPGEARGDGGRPSSPRARTLDRYHRAQGGRRESAAERGALPPARRHRRAPAGNP